MSGRRVQWDLKRTAASIVALLFVLVQFGSKGTPQSPKPSSVRNVDFGNFSYPWVSSQEFSDHLKWMNPGAKEHIQLVHERCDERSRSEKAINSPFYGLVLEGVAYANLCGNSREDAIVVLRDDSGGTLYQHWVYLYDFAGGAPKLMGFFHAGDRAHFGLYRVFAKDQVLTVQLLDPAYEEGDCCSTRYVSYQYRWNGERFALAGTPTKGKTGTASRLQVNIFGLPIDQSSPVQHAK